MHQLVYVSSAREKFSKAELVELLEKSRANNSRLGLTGMLLYKDGNFIQTLEGDESVLRPLFAKISADYRHAGVIVLLDGKIESRNFPDWSMGFRDLSDPSLRDLPGYNEFLNVSLSAIHDPVKSQKLMALFKAKM